MRMFKQRWWSRFALAASLGVVQLVACSSDHPRGEADVQKTGTLGLALEATAQSGTVYRLRNASFVVTDVHSGREIDRLFSEDAPPSARELTDVLQPGSYTIRLEDGWFMERVSGGSSGSGGSSAGTSGSSGAKGGSGGKGGTSSGKGGSFMGEAGAPGSSTGGFGNGAVGNDSFGGAGNETVEVVDAFLLSDAVQFFFISGGDNEFVDYLFQIGGEVVDFNHGTLHVGIDVIEDPSVCQSPPGVLDPRRVLLETDLNATGQIDLGSVFQALATNGGMAADPNLIYQQVYESYASAANAFITDAIHCGDEMTNGVPTLNGYPIDCDRIEHNHVNDEGNFFATAFVNRMDLAPENGAHCGQQRLIFTNQSNARGRAFMILEAQIPNPNPDLGIQGCAPLAEFWREQNDMSDAGARGARLAQAFLSGDPGLLDAGFGPFMTATNLTVGSGQIRTNQFDQSPWTLREFKLALDGQNIKAVPFPTSEAPFGGLWNEAIALPHGDDCRQSFLDAADQLMTNDPSQMSFVVDHACNDAESRNDSSQDYDSQLGSGFRAQLEARLAGSGLTADDFANRAQFAGSCIGCHEEATGKFLGNYVFAPFSNEFVHVQEFPIQCGKSDPNDLCFQPSPALLQVFLPSRLQVMGQILDIPIIPDPCDPNGSGGTGGSSGFGGSFGVGGSAGKSGVGGSFGFGGQAGEISVTGGTGGTSAGSPGTGGRGMGFGGRSGGSAGRGSAGTSMTDPGNAGAGTMENQATPPNVDTPLPPADEPVDEMQSHDEEIRKKYGKRTLSGRSARSTH
jgi:hypothetical protein